MPTRGFTLIELLMVISIIALMSAVVLSGLSSARSKAKDAAIKRQVMEMRTLMAREFSDNGSYAFLKTASYGPITPAIDCPTPGAGTNNLRGTYGQRFRDSCLAIKQTLAGNCGTNNVCLQFDRPTGSANTGKFSIIAYLPDESRRAPGGADRWLCVSYKGHTGVSATVSWNDNPACPFSAGF
ncbi:MAG TPA: type II secretion system protein [Candidatus Paceibacterota bacterium]|nr:type II secretion system protein [Candidatus Paceibacterota bacterium]